MNPALSKVQTSNAECRIKPLRNSKFGIRNLLALVMLGLLLAPDARPEVRSYTVGVDVNCPTGLGE